MLVSSQVRAMPPQFSSRALTRSHGWDAWLPLAGTLLCRFSDNGTPGHYTASEPTSSLNTGECTSQQLPTTLTWQAGAPGPFPRVTRPRHCPRGLRLSGPRTQQVTRGLLPNPAPHGPLAYHGRQARCPGYPLSDTHHSQPRSQPSTGLLHPSKPGSSLLPHQQQNDFHLLISLTH